MSEELLKNYNDLIQRAASAGELELRPDDQERRRQPRFRIADALVGILVLKDCEIVDVSLSGVAFYSERPYSLDQEIQVTLRDSIGVQARVVGCDIEEVDSPFFDCRYTVRCEFVETDAALCLVDVLLDSYHLAGSRPNE